MRRRRARALAVAAGNGLLALAAIAFFDAPLAPSRGLLALPGAGHATPRRTGSAVLPAPAGLRAAVVSRITAADRVDRPSTPADDKS